MNKEALKGQLSASVAEMYNNIRINDLEKELLAIGDSLNGKIQAQDINLIEAMARINSIQRFVDSPENILGAPGTKHGEIAEHVEVGITNAKQAIKGLADRATFDNVGRTAPEDYIVDGLKVQSKFINGTNNTLKHVLDHLDKYAESENFGRDGSFYHIPKDQFSEIMDVLSDENALRLGSKSTRAILEKIEQIEKTTGKKFTDVVRPAHSDYGDVQIEKVQETIDRYRKEIQDENEEILKEINKKAQEEKEKAVSQHKGTVGESVKAGAAAAAFCGVLTLGASIYKKKKEGKKLSEFTEEDWKEIGIDTGKSAAKGGITGFSVSRLTNLTSMSAPVAGGYVSGAIGVASAFDGYRKGEITFSEFIENSEMLCMDTAATVFGSILGQMICPVPCVGMMLGSFVADFVWDNVKRHCTKKELILINEYRDRKQKELDTLNYEYKLFVNEMLEKYKKLGGISAMAFDFDINYQLRFEYSQQLARENGVAESEILKTENDIDDFFLI